MAIYKNLVDGALYELRSEENTDSVAFIKVTESENEFVPQNPEEQLTVSLKQFKDCFRLYWAPVETPADASLTVGGRLVVDGKVVVSSEGIYPFGEYDLSPNFICPIAGGVVLSDKDGTVLKMNYPVEDHPVLHRVAGPLPNLTAPVKFGNRFFSVFSQTHEESDPEETGISHLLIDNGGILVVDEDSVSVIDVDTVIDELRVVKNPAGEGYTIFAGSLFDNEEGELIEGQYHYLVLTEQGAPIGDLNTGKKMPVITPNNGAPGGGRNFLIREQGDIFLFSERGGVMHMHGPEVGRTVGYDHIVNVSRPKGERYPVTFTLANCEMETIRLTEYKAGDGHYYYSLE